MSAKSSALSHNPLSSGSSLSKEKTSVPGKKWAIGFATQNYCTSSSPWDGHCSSIFSFIQIFHPFNLASVFNNMLYSRVDILIKLIIQYWLTASSKDFFFSLFKIWSRVSCSSDWPQTFCVAKDVLELLPSSGLQGSQMLMSLCLAWMLLQRLWGTKSRLWSLQGRHFIQWTISPAQEIDFHTPWHVHTHKIKQPINVKKCKIHFKNIYY